MNTALHRLLPLLTISCCFTAAPAGAVDRAFLTNTDANSLGLEQAWQNSLQAGAGLSGLVDIVLHVEGERSTKFIDIVSDEKILWRKTVGGLDRRTGKPLDETAVKKLAERQLILFKPRGITGEIKETVVAQVTLFALGKDGTLQAIDAETGKSRWVTRHGHPFQPKFSIGVSNNYVVMVSGTTIFQIDSSNGSLVATEKCSGVPIEGPLLAGDYAVIATVGGGVESHFMKDITESPHLSMTSGQAVAKARVFPKSPQIAWPTDNGFVYCIETSGTPAELFRLKSPGIVTGRVETVGTDLMYFCSESGHVYSIQATRQGTFKWGVSTGEPMYGNMVVFGENAYATSGYGNLFAFKASSGEYAWDGPAPNVEKVIGEFGDRILALDSARHLTAISKKTGGRIGTVNGTRIYRAIVNRATDRVYIITGTGAIQCLRPIGKELATLKQEIEFKEEVKEEDMAPAADAAGDNPFGAGNPDDPFGNANPFDGGGGAMDDPFGAGGGDPFGGGAGGDPFGGSPF